MACSTEGCGKAAYARGLCRRCYAALMRAGLPRVHRHQRASVYVDDVAWMLASGETHPDMIAARCGIQRESLVKALRRAGRPDLAARLTRGAR